MAVIRPSLLGSDAFAPAFDVRETKDHYVFSVDLPGVPEEALEISFCDGTLTLSGQREEEPIEADRVLLDERRFGAFTRSFTLPEPVNAEDMEVRFEQGVLHVKLPKEGEGPPRRISPRTLLHMEGAAA